jgi:hypothetical protein
MLEKEGLKATVGQIIIYEKGFNCLALPAPKSTIMALHIPGLPKDHISIRIYLLKYTPTSPRVLA